MSVTFKYDSWLWGISLLILSEVMTRWMTLFNGIFSFELIYSDEILDQIKIIIIISYSLTK